MLFRSSALLYLALLIARGRGNFLRKSPGRLAERCCERNEKPGPHCQRCKCKEEVCPQDDVKFCASGADLARDPCNNCEFPPCPCGGFTRIPCHRGETCIDDPSDLCDPERIRICPGICVEGCLQGCPEDIRICANGDRLERDRCMNCEFPPCPCGGIAGFPCNKGEACVDIPDDDCDPAKGGSDCPGTCSPCDAICLFDVKECPDGSSVSRDHCNNCEFRPCPTCDNLCLADVKECPDGSSVPRDPCNNCEFQPCPPCRGPCPTDAIVCPDGTVVGRDACCKFLPCPCGGIAGSPCPAGETCVDDPNDRCDPATGGEDCAGICVE